MGIEARTTSRSAYHPGTLDNLSFLVTGGAGFIGSHIVAYLLANGAREVRVLDNLCTGYINNLSDFSQHPAFRFMEGDIRNIDICREACKGVDYVLHQAALGSVPRSVNDPQTTHDVNVNGFMNVLIASRESGVKRMVYASSSSVYGNSEKLPKQENSIGFPLSPYAASKRVNEVYADAFAVSYGMELVGLRYFNVFGPRQSPEGPYAAVIPVFMNALSRNEAPFINGDGLQTRDFTYVDNAVQANIKALFARHLEGPGHVFNIAVGESVTIRDVFDFISKLLGKNMSPQYRAKRQADVRHSLADISRARQALGYEPEVSFMEGLKTTVQALHSEKVS
ncbi:MAG: SDR family oxidoreductase [Flavobacteriales bacterium]|nr:SDR family oxidoreductase [Flavobacteriales bacterium]